jgi:hypothetical protein
MSESDSPRRAPPAPSRNGEVPPGQSSTPIKDAVFLHSPTDDGKGVNVIRARNGAFEVGELRPLEEGKPLHSEIVTLNPRADAPRICDVEVTYAPPTTAKITKPAQVATDVYRASWERIFAHGASRTVDSVAESGGAESSTANEIDELAQVQTTPNLDRSRLLN